MNLISRTLLGALLLSCLPMHAETRPVVASLFADVNGIRLY